jgi:Holliday junction resolvase
MVRINAKRKGTAFERIVKKLIQKQNPRSEVFRSPASLGSADLVIITKDEYETDSNSRIFVTSKVELVQCKYLKKYMSKKETDRIVEDADKLGAKAWLVYREKPRGRIRFQSLTTKSHS